MRTWSTAAIVAFSTVLFWLVSGTLLFHALEHWSWNESFYFSVTTLATVGFGDLHPTTDASRMVTAFYVLLGSGTTASAFAYLGSKILAARERRISERRKGL